MLGFVFGSLLAFVPLLMAVPAIMTSFLAVLGLTVFTDISPIVQFLIALIGLGVAIDYSLIVVVRWREELAHGPRATRPSCASMATAGRAVVFSGTTVAIGLLALVVLPLPFLRSVGYGGMLIPLVSVLVALTLLPVVLHSAGARLDWPHRRTDDRASAAWTRWAEAIVRHRGLAAAAAALVLAALVLAATNLHPGLSNVDTIAKAGVAKQGLQSRWSARGSAPARCCPTRCSSTRPARRRSCRPSAAWTASTGPWPRPTGARAARRSSRPSRSRTAPARAAGPWSATCAPRRARPDPSARLGGQPAANKDFIDAVYGSFPLMIALISVITFVLLARAFRSLLLPAKAVLLNIVSVAAAWGVLEIVWQSGHGSDAIWGIAATGSITAWIPLMVFAFLFGLSMDYEVFILSRMREEYDRTGSTDVAVVRGIGRTGRLVTSAAIILFLAFLSLASGPETDVKVLATGLAAGILLDATIIRALLVPAVVSLFGRWNWVLPRLPARILRVEPSLPPRAATAERGAG